MKANNELLFSMADLYPNMGGMDTGSLATPEADDQDALNEDIAVAEEVSPEAKGKNIFIALAVIVGLIIFFGGK